MGFIEHEEHSASQLPQGKLPSGGTRPGRFFFFFLQKIYLFISLAAPALSCGTQNL